MAPRTGHITQGRPNISPGKKVSIYAFLILLILGGLEMKFYSFLPSPIVIRYGGWIALAGTVCGIFWLIWNWRSWQSGIRNADVRHHPTAFGRWAGRKPVFMAVTSVVFGAMVLYLTAVRLVPHAVTLTIGTPGEQDFTVSRVDSDKDCERGIQLEEATLFADEVCLVPEDLRAQMRRGSQVTIHGKKSWAGIIPESIALKTVRCDQPLLQNCYPSVSRMIQSYVPDQSK